MELAALGAARGFTTDCLRRQACRLALPAAMLLAMSPPGEATGQPRGLFATEGLEPGTAVSRGSSTSPDSAVAKRRLVRIDLGQLTPGAYAAPPAGGSPTAAESLTLNLFDDVVFAATVERTAPTSSGGYSLSGPLDGVEFGSMTLVVNGGIVAGTVHTPLTTYAIRPVADGVSVVHEVDRAFECELWDPWVDARGSPGAAGGPTFPAADPVDATADPVDPAAAESDGAEDGSVIDLLVVHTPAARAGFGGTPQIEAFVDLAVADLNRSLEASGVIQRVNLVHQAEVAYTEASNHNDLVRHLADPTDGNADEAHTLRDAYAADLVHLIQAGSFLGGVAQVLGPFGATHYDTLSLLSHELGHSMGLQHDRYNEPSNYPFPYSHGYVNQAAFEPGAPPDSRFATLMAYITQCRDAGFFCPWTNTFSNPDLTYNGYPLGVPGDEPSSAVDGPADARRSLNELRTTVANFRVRESGPDLVVRAPAVSDPTLEPDQAFTFSAAIGNIGDLPAAATAVTYYRSPASGISAADAPVGTGAVSGLGARSTTRASIDLVAPADPGIYYYGACVQAVGDETAVANNCSWGAWVVVGDGTDTECWNDLGTLQFPGSIGRTGSWNGACEGVIYYGLSLGRTTRLTIDLTSPSVNTALVLACCGAIVETAVAGGAGTNARITTTLEPARYVIRASVSSQLATGPFTLTVAASDPAHRHPEPVGTLSPLTLGAHGAAADVEVSGAFHDPDGDALTYAATSSVPAVAAVAVSGSTVTVMPLAAGTAKVTVTATDTNGSNTPAIQTFTVAVFTDHPIAAGATALKAVHFRELRARIAALRANEGLPAMQWTDPALAAGVTPVRRVHLTELRAALDAVYDAAGRARPSYSDATVTAGTTAIRAVHIMELRAFAAAAE